MPVALAERKRQLLNPDFLARLDRLDLLSRKILAGKLSGERPARQAAPAAALLPIDYREYSAGDDLRFIDWNIYARLDRLLLKLFAQEEDFFLHVLIDVSKSCDYGLPGKALYLRQVAAALGYVGLVNHHHVAIHAIGDESAAQSGQLHGRSRASAMIEFLAALETGGESRFEQECSRFAAGRNRPGICVVLSDFLFAGGVDAGLAYLRAAKHDLFCIQVLSPQELRPTAAAETIGQEIIDMERRHTAKVAVTPLLLEEYQSNLTSYCRSVSESVTRYAGSYVLTRTAQPFDRLVLDHLRRRGLVG
jgi:uncharacterized protein (DUF58 family)